MSYSDLNKNINDYSIENLIEIFELNDEPTVLEIENNVNKFINQFEEKGNDELINFLYDAKQKLINKFKTKEKEKNIINYVDEDDVVEYDVVEGVVGEDTDDAEKWYKRQYLKNSSNQQNEKITDRKQKISTWNENQHYPMKRKELGVSNNYQLPVMQDILNPNLVNVYNRILNIDSQFRPNILPFNSIDPNSASSSTNYSIELNEIMTNVISLNLLSVQIPNTWYRFSPDQGNTCLFLIDGSNNEYSFILPPGNYSVDELLLALNNSNNWTGGVPFVWTFNKITNKLEFNNTKDVTFYFFDLKGNYNCGISCFGETLLNQNLGWSLGFRAPLIDDVSKETFPPVTPPNKNSADAVIDLYGSKYFAIVLDDFNQNRNNKGIVNITQSDTRLNIPPYYMKDIPIDCSTNTIQDTIPRRLTRAQLYSLNQILVNRIIPKQRNYGVNASDVIALLPININPNSTEQVFTLFGDNLLANPRKYFGPVDISRLKIKLVDDKGNTVNLNGADWCFSLLVTELYQY